MFTYFRRRLRREPGGPPQQSRRPIESRSWLWASAIALAAFAVVLIAIPDGSVVARIFVWFLGAAVLALKALQTSD